MKLENVEYFLAGLNRLSKETGVVIQPFNYERLKIVRLDIEKHEQYQLDLEDILVKWSSTHDE